MTFKPLNPPKTRGRKRRNTIGVRIDTAQRAIFSFPAALIGEFGVYEQGTVDVAVGTGKDAGKIAIQAADRAPNRLISASKNSVSHQLLLMIRVTRLGFVTGPVDDVDIVEHKVSTGQIILTIPQQFWST